jgi:ketosteroid isomerase-like protein
VDHPNIDLVRGVYAAYLSGDRDALIARFDPSIRWHNSGFDATAGDLEGVDQVLGYLFADNHLEDYSLEVVDILASDERVAVVARTTGRAGDRSIANEFVQVIRMSGGRVGEVWNYNWDQQALAEAFPVAA